jgi:hypothetical protein
MDDRPISPTRRWSVVRLCQSSRHQSQLLAQAYQQIFPQVRQPLLPRVIDVTAARRGSCVQCSAAAARVAAGA